MNLSKNFTLKELIASSKAQILGIDNNPGSVYLKNLFFLCQFGLQLIRDKHGRVDITSGFRCLDLNRAVGSKDTSEHILGCAADFRTPNADLKEVFNWIQINLIFGQVIYEAPPNKDPWIHMSLPRLNKPNQQALIFDGRNYRMA